MKIRIVALFLLVLIAIPTGVAYLESIYQTEEPLDVFVRPTPTITPTQETEMIATSQPVSVQFEEKVWPFYDIDASNDAFYYWGFLTDHGIVIEHTQTQ